METLEVNNEAELEALAYAEYHASFEYFALNRYNTEQDLNDAINLTQHLSAKYGVEIYP